MSPGTSSVRLAVFDCDGTLVDSQANILLAMVDAFEAAGLAPPDAHTTRRIVGLSLIEAMEVLVPAASPALHARLTAAYKQAFWDRRRDKRLDPEPLYPGIAEGLATLGEAGWLLGVATGKSDRGLALILEHHGLAHHFVTLQTADRHPSKPHPAMLYAALAEAGCALEDAVMIGDTVFDIAMARNAGVRAIGVDWGYHDPQELHDAGAAAVVSTMDELLLQLEAR
ncbi:HAD-IA family hydrolase [Sphingosinicellaceae bacterium]|nr:HAD-IA family hydrolase [Sphingosinicellaceae bacterium]